jgi:hypothetical protein
MDNPDGLLHRRSHAANGLKAVVPDACFEWTGLSRFEQGDQHLVT